MKGAVSKLANTGVSGLEALRLDASTLGLMVIDYSHHEIHAGSSFHLQLSTDDLGGETGDHLHISFTTPDSDKFFHMVAQSYGAGQHLFEMREAPTGGMAGGASMTPLNRNRNSSRVSSAINPVNGATVGTGGTLLSEEHVGQGNSNEGRSRGTQEWMLKANTLYSFRLYDTTNIQAVLTLDWYEHTDKY